MKIKNTKKNFHLTSKKERIKQLYSSYISHYLCESKCRIVERISYQRTLENLRLFPYENCLHLKNIFLQHTFLCTIYIIWYRKMLILTEADNVSDYVSICLFIFLHNNLRVSLYRAVRPVVLLCSVFLMNRVRVLHNKCVMWTANNVFFRDSENSMR